MCIVIDIEPRLIRKKMRLGLLNDRRTLIMAREFVAYTEIQVFDRRMTLENPHATAQQVAEALNVLPILEDLLRGRKDCLHLVEDECGYEEAEV